MIEINRLYFQGLHEFDPIHFLLIYYQFLSWFEMALLPVYVAELS